MTGDIPASDAGAAFRQHFRRILALDPDAPAIEFESQWMTWHALSLAADIVAESLAATSIIPGEPVGVILRNRPASIGLLVGTTLAGGCVVVLNPHVGPQRVRDEVDALGLRLVSGEPSDIDALFGDDPPPAVATFAVAALGAPGRLTAAARSGVAAETRVDTAIRLLTSGTTGPPKRSDLTYETLQRVLEGAKHYESQRSDDVRLRDGVVIVNSPLVHLGGVFRVVQAFHDGRRISLLERFTVEDWVDRVRRHQPKTASLVPAALRMVLDADIDPADIASLRSVVSGTAPLSPETAEAFTTKYGVPVLTNYAATEFGGGVAGWNLADHRRYWHEKRGSVGRAHPGCELRVVDETTGVSLDAGHVGLLEVRAAQLGGATWVRTTDLARLDEDGFLWILGRADQTIIRGGLKVQPDTVRRALERHPAVRAAAVIGIDDDRLGQVPVAVVEATRPGAIDRAELLTFSAETLARYEIPVAIVIVDSLPRTESGKADLHAIRKLVPPSTRDREG